MQIGKLYSVICFGGEDWWYHNRGHIDMQLMRRFSRVAPTVYVNSIVMQKPGLAQGREFIQKLNRKLKSIFKGLQKSDAGFWVYSPFSLPVHHIRWLRVVNSVVLRLQLWVVAHKLGLWKPIVWVACPAACDVAVKMKKAKMIYQRTDRFEEFHNVDAETIKQFDRKLKISADLTVFVNNNLFEEEAGQCRKAVYLDHGVDYDMFAGAEQDPQKPEDIANITGPIVGFFGGIDDHTSDIGFVERVVDFLSEMSFVFVGKVSSDCSRLAPRKNVLMLGQKPYERIPHYGKCFDVAIMPWQQNRWIEACNPIKLKEYLALGKPVVSTPFTELQKYLDVVYVANTPEDFAQCIVKALNENSPERIAARRKKVEASTWDNKAQLVLNELFGKAGDLQEST
jgi:glycosyltransferase involved in cell wall biosynthesis